MNKKITGIAVAALLIVSSPINIIGEASEKVLPITLYQDVDNGYIGKGIYYEKITRLTDQGWLDINVVRVDLKEESIAFKILESQKAGDKEPLSYLVEEMNKNGERVVAGINGDFFATNKVLTVALGPTIKDGMVQNAYDVDHRVEKKDQYMFIQNKDKEVSFQLPGFQFGFMNTTGAWTEITSMNKMTSIYTPSFFDRRAIENTDRLDKLNNALMKIVVDEDKIINIKRQGETVTVPENGYVITMDSGQFKEIEKYNIGDTVMFNAQLNMDVEEIALGMTGGGLILKDGVMPEETGLIVGKASRHPRSAVGLSEDKNQLIMVTVDGRGKSMGATMEETSAMMKEFGAKDAVMMDGGGSTTMVVRPSGQQDTKIVNDPSGAFERPVINGLGVSSLAPKTNKIAKLKLYLSREHVFLNNFVQVGISAIDTNYHPTVIEEDQIKYQAVGVSGFWDGNKFYPTSQGEGKIKITYKGATTESKIYVMEPANLMTSKNQLFLAAGESKAIKIYGKDLLGFTAPVDTMSLVWSVTGDIGTISQGIFTAGNQSGFGKLSGRLGDTVISFDVSIGENSGIVSNFNDEEIPVEAVVYPKEVEASVAYSDGAEGKGLELNYSFIGETEANQGAYLTFTDTVKIEGEPFKLGLDIQGDNSKKWLRAKIVDSKGDVYTVDFAKKVDWNGWAYKEANVPESVSYPIALARVYMVSLDQADPISSTIKIDNLVAKYPIRKAEEVEEVGLIKDYQQLSHEVIMKKEGSKIAVFGSTAGKNNILDNIVQESVIKQMNEYADLGVFAGHSDIDVKELMIPALTWKNKYEVVDYGDLRMIQLATGSGGLRQTAPEQWKLLVKQLKETTANNILLIGNADPLGGFKDKEEGKLLHRILSDFATESGKNIYVINASGYKTDNEIYEGVHYIDLSGLWYKDKAEKLDLQNTFYMLLFNIGNDGLTYAIKPIYDDKN